MAPLHYDRHRLESETGKSLFDYADSLKVRVPTSCGRTGECHECIVDVRRGMDALSPHSDSEKFLRDNYSLAWTRKHLGPPTLRRHCSQDRGPHASFPR